MKRSELIEQLEAYLTLNQQVSDDSAPGMKFLRLAFTEMQRPTDTIAELQELRSQLDSADRAIATLNDRNEDLESIVYDLLMQAGLVPEVDGEVAISYAVAVKEDPDCIEKLKTALIGHDNSDDNQQFISAVRNLMDPIAAGGAQSISLQALLGVMEAASDSYASMEQGIMHRDNLLQQAEDRILAIRRKLGIPDTARGSVDHLEIANIELLVQQRMDAQDRRLVRNAPGIGDVTRLEWEKDAIDLAHAVRGDLSPENRVMAKAADQIILRAPKGEA